MIEQVYRESSLANIGCAYEARATPSDLRYSKSMRSVSSGTRGRSRRRGVMSRAPERAARRPARASGSGLSGGTGSAAARRQRPAPCSPAERAVHYATCWRPAPRLPAERRTNAAVPTDPDALLRRRECNRHTYSRLVPINASTTKATCDGECGRIWQQMQWVRHVRAYRSTIRRERDGAAHCGRGLHSSSLLP